MTLPLLGLSLIPTFQDREVLVHLVSQPGTSNPRMTEIATEVAGRLEAIPGVGNVGAHVGRAVTGDRVTNVNASDVWVSIDADADYGATMNAINAAARNVQGAEHEVVTYSAQKLRDVGAITRGENRVRGNDLDVLTGVDKPLVVRIFGQNTEVLRREASRVKKIMSTVDGVVDPRIDLPATQPSIEIEVDLDRAQQFGVTPGAVRRAEATLLQGIRVGSIFSEQKVFDVIVQGAPGTRGSVEDVRNLLIDRPEGGHVTLGQVADVRVVDTAAVIRRDAVSRRVDVEAGVTGRSTGAVAAEIESRLAKVAFPLEYHAECSIRAPEARSRRAESRASPWPLFSPRSCCSRRRLGAGGLPPCLAPPCRCASSAGCWPPWSMAPSCPWAQCSGCSPCSGSRHARTCLSSTTFSRVSRAGTSRGARSYNALRMISWLPSPSAR
jgi:Cu/Ag efflux pump CusA